MHNVLKIYSIMFFIQNYDIEKTQIQKDTFQFHYEQIPYQNLFW
jgi:hypothetical protein